jgi:hypothetical protein
MTTTAIVASPGLVSVAWRGCGFGSVGAPIG